MCSKMERRQKKTGAMITAKIEEEEKKGDEWNEGKRKKHVSWVRIKEKFMCYKKYSLDCKTIFIG